MGEGKIYYFLKGKQNSGNSGKREQMKKKGSSIEIENVQNDQNPGR